MNGISSVNKNEEIITKKYTYGYLINVSILVLIYAYNC